MKKGIIILCTVLVTFSLAALGYTNWNKTVNDPVEKIDTKTASFDSDLLYDITRSKVPALVYKIDSRFIHRITKEEINKAVSIADILPEKATRPIQSYQGAKISLIEAEQGISEEGNSEILTPAQKDLLLATDYTSNVAIAANFTARYEEDGELRKDYFRYSTSIVPEKVAEYNDGSNTLIDYLKENSRAATAIIRKEGLKAGIVKFTVTKEGTIANVKLFASSGYPSVDEVLVDLITNMPGSWNPAMNATGDTVDQELVFFFGLEGC